MNRLRVFLASSSELKNERQQFEIFINRKNKEWFSRGVFIELIIWEDFLDAVSKTRLQDEYNKEICRCDIFVSLFYTKVGKYTLEEFETAFDKFEQDGRPLIYTYFKVSEVRMDNINRKNMEELWEFQEKLTELGHFQSTFNNKDELLFKFSNQLDKLVEKGFIKFDSDLLPKGLPELEFHFQFSKVVSFDKDYEVPLSSEQGYPYELVTRLKIKKKRNDKIVIKNALVYIDIPEQLEPRFVHFFGLLPYGKIRELTNQDNYLYFTFRYSERTPILEDIFEYGLKCIVLDIEYYGELEIGKSILEEAVDSFRTFWSNISSNPSSDYNKMLQLKNK